ncbi:MAG: hypothetical protein WBW99_08205 [Pseudolabrys sp.]
MRKGAPAAENAQTKNANTTIGLGDSKRLKLAKIMASQQYQERQWYCIARLCMEQQARLFFAPYALGRRDEETEDKCRHRPDDSHA